MLDVVLQLNPLVNAKGLIPVLVDAEPLEAWEAESAAHAELIAALHTCRFAFEYDRIAWQNPLVRSFILAIL